MTKRPRASITMPVGTPVSLDEMHDLIDVCMNAIHVSFDGKTIDARALYGGLMASALAVLRDAGHPNPRALAIDFVLGVDLAEVRGFDPEYSA